MSIEHGRTLWMEDDATALSDPDHETVRKAYLRIFGKEWNPDDVIEKSDEGDGVDYLMPKCVVWMSYPGNSAIYAKPEVVAGSTEVLEQDKEWKP